MDTGTLGELKATAKLAELGYDIFLPTSGKTDFDLIAHKNGLLYRVEVKTTTVQSNSGKWEVQLRSIRSNKTRNKKIHFDNTKTDLLAVYIVPQDRVEIINSCDIKTKSMISIK